MVKRIKIYPQGISPSLLLFNRYVMSNSFATPQTIAHQVPLSMRFSRQEYWSGLPFPSAEDLPNPGIKPTSPTLAGGFFTTSAPGKPIPFIMVSQTSQRSYLKENSFTLLSLGFSETHLILLLIWSFFCTLKAGNTEKH